MIIERRQVGAEENRQQNARTASEQHFTLAEVSSAHPNASRSLPTDGQFPAFYCRAEELCGVVLDDDDGRVGARL